MINWKSINTVFFDMDGTLLDLHFDNYFWLDLVPKVYANKNGLSGTSAYDLIYKKYEEKRGQLDWYCIEYWSKTLKLDIMALKSTVFEKVRLRPNVKEFLENIKTHNKKMILITNAHRTTLDFKMHKVQIDKFFDKMISAHGLGLAKEQPGFWDRLRTVEPFDKEKTLFIDDSNAVLTAAKNYGFLHLLGISEPDLHADPVRLSDFATIADFKEIMIEHVAE